MNNELNKLYEEKSPYFMMALAHLMDHGFNKVMAMTDEQIAAQKGNELMTDSFVQELNRLTRDIARASNGSPMQLISFCTEKELGCNFEKSQARQCHTSPKTENLLILRKINTSTSTGTR